MSKKPERELVCKVVVVGDGAVGKTCILAVYQKNQFPAKYVPTVFENFTSTISIGEKKISLGLWDTAGQEDYDRLRPLSYPVSLENVKNKWIPEIKRETGGISKFILVGTKMDLRDDKKTLETLALRNMRPVSQEDGEKSALDIGAKGYLECSALQNQGVKQCFDKAIRVALFEKKDPPPSKTTCTIL